MNVNPFGLIGCQNAFHGVPTPTRFGTKNAVFDATYCKQTTKFDPRKSRRDRAVTKTAAVDCADCNDGAAQFLPANPANPIDIASEQIYHLSQIAHIARWA